MQGMIGLISSQYSHIFGRMQSFDKSQLSSWIKLTDDFYLDPDGLLGKGCYGEVFRGYSTKRDKLVAIKTVQGEGYEREVETLMTLASLNHPSIMGYYGFQHIKDSAYIFVEYCPNGTLTDLINEGIPEDKALELFRQMLEGMCYMNAKDRMHRDLKPDNILLGMDKDVKISDFGLARETTGIFVTGQMGTPLYAGPEVYLNKYDENYSKCCDVWGAGMILYQMLTGKLLFQNVNTFEDLKKEWHLYENGQRRVKYDATLHPNWEYFTNYMLTYDPKKRPTFHEVLDKLKKVYDKMLQQIRNKEVHTADEKTKIGRLEIFLKFTADKYAILTRISQRIHKKPLSIRSELKSIIEFLALTHYVCRAKRLMRNIKYRRVSVGEDGEDLVEQSEDCNLLLDKYHNFFENKYNLYTDQLSKCVLTLLEIGKKPQSQDIVKDFKSVWELVADVSDGTYDVEETYCDQLKNLLKSKLDHYHKGLPECLKGEEVRMLHLIYLGALVEQLVDSQNYLKKNFIKDILAKAKIHNREEQLKYVSSLKKMLK